MPALQGSRTISGAVTPTTNDDGWSLRVTANATVTLSASGWTVGRSGMFFPVTGAASVTFVGAGGVNVRNRNGDLVQNVQYAGATALYTATNEWTIYGSEDFQPLDAELSAIAGLTSAADRLPYFTGSGTASLATFTAAGRALVDDADAAAQRTTLGVGTVSSSPGAPTSTPTAVGDVHVDTSSAAVYVASATSDDEDWAPWAASVFALPLYGLTGYDASATPPGEGVIAVYANAAALLAAVPPRVAGERIQVAEGTEVKMLEGRWVAGAWAWVEV